MTAANPRTIKRYANRKLYDTQDSRYVTLDQIAEMIRNGEDVKVIDNGSKEDLTSVTLAQIIFEEEKRQRSFLPLSALRKIIQSGGDSLHDFVNQIQTSTARIFHRDEDGEPGLEATAEGGDAPATVEAAAHTEAAPQGAPEGTPENGATGSDSSAMPIRALREFVDNVHQTVDEWQRKVDANVHSALESVSLPAPLQKEMGRLKERIGELERKLSFRRTETTNAEETTQDEKPA